MSSDPHEPVDGAAFPTDQRIGKAVLATQSAASAHEIDETVDLWLIPGPDEATYDNGHIVGLRLFACAARFLSAAGDAVRCSLAIVGATAKREMPPVRAGVGAGPVIMQGGEYCRLFSRHWSRCT